MITLAHVRREQREYPATKPITDNMTIVAGDPSFRLLGPCLNESLFFPHHFSNSFSLSGEGHVARMRAIARTRLGRHTEGLHLT